ncbi:hypothetical protein [Nonomuraea sp. NPDC050310]|uniref:hypothetical protein n=1 Tax=Nonomuraea sp. NPDC050310 TaxID=3154935 RepID=UPI0033D6FAC5
MKERTVYEQSLPAGPDAAPSASAWIRAIAGEGLAERAASVITGLVAGATARSPHGGRIKITATLEPGELRIEVRTPSNGFPQSTPPGWAECSSHAWSMATRETEDHYSAEASVRPMVAVGS